MSLTVLWRQKVREAMAVLRCVSESLFLSIEVWATRVLPPPLVSRLGRWVAGLASSQVVHRWAEMIIDNSQI